VENRRARPDRFFIRREFIAAVGGAAVTWPLAVQSRVSTRTRAFSKGCLGCAALLFYGPNRKQLTSWAAECTAPCRLPPSHVRRASFARAIPSHRKARATAPVVTSTAMNAMISVAAESLSISQLYI